ncbi:MAG: outer membrane lipoprotein-sorting protein [Rhodospirillaceae bacterium]|nr:MAG: outer membrane lipoprotein-sorting protein [Rhodospirillaceae bacterium]
MKKILILSLWGALCGTFTLAQAFAAPPLNTADRGRSAAAAWKATDLGFHDSMSNMKIDLIDKSGQTSVRSLHMKVLEKPTAETGDQILMRFVAPRNVKGTSVLIHSKVGTSDDVWLLLPALRRTKRIAAADKSGSFAGSEFSYEDIGSMELANYKYEWLGEEACDQLTCAIVKQTPLYPYSGYNFIIVRYDTSQFRQMKIEFFDRKDQLVKTLQLGGYQKYKNKHWRAETMSMSNHITGKKSILKMTDYKFGIGLLAREFRPRQLKELLD